MRQSPIARFQNKLIEHFVASTAARCAADLMDISRKIVVYYFQRLRETIIAYQLDQASEDAFDGEIGVD